MGATPGEQHVGNGCRPHAISLSGVTVADMLLTRSILRNRVTHAQFSYLRAVTRLVTFGLCLLAVTGLALLLYYRLYNPVLLTSPKLWAKYAIVGVIALNGADHARLFSGDPESLDRPLLSAPEIRKRSGLLFSCGAVSFVSWYSALFLGVWREANFTVTFQEVFGSYLLLLCGAVLGSWVLGRLIIGRSKDVRFFAERAGERQLTDPVTGANNFRYLHEVLTREIERSRRYDAPLYLFFMDIDRFESINRRYGEWLGNELLKMIVVRAGKHGRETDYFAVAAATSFSGS